MNTLLVLNNVLSIMLVFVCWWLSHQNATGREPFGRTIATGYSFLAMAALGNMLFRNVDQLGAILPLSLLISKGVLVFTLGVVAARLGLIHPPR